jgi:hypothetical protein
MRAVTRSSSSNAFFAAEGRSTEHSAAFPCGVAKVGLEDDVPDRPDRIA